MTKQMAAANCYRLAFTEAEEGLVARIDLR